MNLLLVSIDSLRLDHAPHVDGGVEAPRFTRAAEGLAFSERCFSVSSATRPVHTSLITGLPPSGHGILAQTDRHVRPGTGRLFAELAAAGFRVGLYSEAPTIFTGLDLGAPVRTLPVAPAAGLELRALWLARAGEPRCLFVHYWSTHTPYGAADGRALGETAELLRSGRQDVVRARYRGAVVEAFEHKLAPLLEALELSDWAVFLFGDHGESWTPDELYHGATVRNAVLRVPLYAHVPYSGNGLLDGDAPLSLLDLHPTLRSLGGLPPAPVGGTESFGVDLTSAGTAARAACRVAEIRPGAADADERVLDASDAAPGPTPRRWCVLDAELKLLGEDDEETGQVDPWTEAPAAGDARRHRQALARLRAAAWDRETRQGAMDPEADALLRRRLRDLGYLE